MTTSIATRPSRTPQAWSAVTTPPRGLTGEAIHLVMLGMDAEMLKGHLDAVVLAALETGRAHGYAIIETIRTRSGDVFDLPEGTVYPALHRLEQAGLLSSTWETPPSGRRRRVYALTQAGVAALRERRKTWDRFAQAVDSFLGGPRAWPA
jgi:PadR family transcriptional regulator PadR